MQIERDCVHYLGWQYLRRRPDAYGRMGSQAEEAPSLLQNHVPHFFPRGLILSMTRSYMESLAAFSIAIFHRFA